MKRKTFGILAIAACALIGSGCATQLSLISKQAKKTVTVKGSLDEALAAAMAGGKDLGYSVSSSSVVGSNNTKKVMTAARGWGYFEFSSLTAQFSESNGTASAEFTAKSNKGSEEILNEYLAAVGKHAQVQ